MSLNNYYNFRNSVRHFIKIDHLGYPMDINSFNPIDNLSWTKPISFRVYKADDKFRTIKIPNVLNFVRAYYYYSGLPNFNNVENMDVDHKRLAVNINTGDFVSGNYNKQLDEDFLLLCNYDVLVKLDISEYYGRIYTHYLGWDTNGLKDNPLAWLNYGRTSGLLMGNYLSLYFAEYLSSRISNEIENYIVVEGINCKFKYFSDDFYFYCNEGDIEKIIRIFDKSLEKFDFTRKEKKEIWTYETFNIYNILTRYWKATIRAWNLEVLKDYENNKKHPCAELFHKYTFLNQLVYRLSSLPDEKSKRSFINNFFKTRHFQECDFSKYKLYPYDLHQLFYLIKTSPESLLYIAHNIRKMPGVKEAPSTKMFMKARYEEALKKELHDVQLYYFYAISILGYRDVIRDASSLVVNTQNQILISYYLKDNLFSSNEIFRLQLIEDEDFWFQNYHMILYVPTLMSDVNTSVRKYLLPEKLRISSNVTKENRYLDFYVANLNVGNALIRDIVDVKNQITEYLSARYEETAVEFDV